jgi:Protein of unknown function, DUF481
MKGVLLLWLLLAAGQVNAQLVNIESRRIHNDSMRCAGEFNFNFSYRDINDKKFSVLSSNLMLQLKSKNFNSYWLFLGAADISKAGGSKFENSHFLHLRYNQKWGKIVRWEAFAQFQRNLPIGIQWRYLFGTGPRFKLLSSQLLHLYAGVLYMYDYERTTNDVLSRGSRNSTYASFTIHVPAIKMEMTGTTYYQPLLQNFKDYRILSENRLAFNITKKFKVQTSFRYYFDSRPPTGFVAHTIALEQGFSVSF